MICRSNNSFPSLRAACFLACTVLRKDEGDALVKALPSFASKVPKSKWAPAWVTTSDEAKRSNLTPPAPPPRGLTSFEDAPDSRVPVLDRSLGSRALLSGRSELAPAPSANLISYFSCHSASSVLKPETSFLELIPPPADKIPPPVHQLYCSLIRGSRRQNSKREWGGGDLKF